MSKNVAFMQIYCQAGLTLIVKSNQIELLFMKSGKPPITGGKCRIRFDKFDQFDFIFSC